MGDSACAKMHFDVVGDFAFIFLQNYTVKCKTHFDVAGDFAFILLQNCTVKCIDNEDSDSHGHSVYISIERMS